MQMSIPYKINVNDAFHFDFENESISQLDAVSVETNKFHILHQNIPYKAEIVSSHFNQKKYTIKVNNNTYHVAISNPLDTLIKEMGFAVGKTKQVNVIKAPMPGLILEINVIIGQAVKENDNLLILTAMKMENSFLSPREGIIKNIAISVGDSVVKGDLLIEFEE
jgi:biotin carboxyl carrier protein